MLRICLLLFCSAFAVVATAGEDVWLLIDTKARKIEVKKGEQTLETINKIAIGRGGAGAKTHRGDNITPYGSYRIGWIGERSNFRKFFGLTYPSVEDAEKALHKGIIDEYTYGRIVTAHQYHHIPPQNTPLGGQIGIHGLGRGDVRVHETFDWTHGCIALTNGQIDHLSQLVDTGTVVKIK
ncbi:MAG: L,D-transpeptidase [Methylococcales bacterium]